MIFTITMTKSVNNSNESEKERGKQNGKLYCN